LQQPFFFLIAPASPFLFDRAKSADSLIDANQVFAGFPEPMELRDLVLRLAQRSRIREGFGYALAGDSPGQTELRVMTGIIGLGAMARRLTAANALRLCDRTGPQVARAEEIFEESGSVGFQRIEGIRH
jgi:hypothetical protein